MGLTGAVEVIQCTCITLIAPVLLPQSAEEFKLCSKSVGSTGHGETWDRASAMTLSLPLKYSICTLYWASLSKSLQSWTG